MTLRELVVVVLVLALGQRSASAADVDCKQVPQIEDGSKCCKLPDMSLPEVQERCKQYFVSDDKPEIEPGPLRRRPTANTLCAVECIFNNTGVVDENFQLVKARLDDYLANMLQSTPDLIPILADAFDKCLANNNIVEREANILKERQRRHPDDPPPQCPLRSFLLMRCLQYRTFKNCPASARDTGDDCQQLRAYVENCKWPHRPPPHPDTVDDSESTEGI